MEEVEYRESLGWGGEGGAFAIFQYVIILGHAPL